MRRDLDRPGLTSGAKIHRCARSVGVADPYRCPVTSSDSSQYVFRVLRSDRRSSVYRDRTFGSFTFHELCVTILACAGQPSGLTELELKSRVNRASSNWNSASSGDVTPSYTGGRDAVGAGVRKLPHASAARRSLS